MYRKFRKLVMSNNTTVYLLLTISAIIFIMPFIGIGDAAAVPPGPIVSWDERYFANTYVGNETITFSAHVIEEQLKPLVISIYNPDHTLCKWDIVKVNPDDKSFSYSFVIDCEGRATGYYSLEIGYMNGLVNGYGFMYVAGPYELLVDDRTFPINYKVRGGDITNMSIRLEQMSLIIDTANVTELTIELPREVIDSTDGRIDSNFTVWVDGSNGYYSKEIDSNENTRTLLISLCDPQLPEYCGELETGIVGTQVVPEFDSSIVSIIMTIGILGVIIAIKH